MKVALQSWVCYLGLMVEVRRPQAASVPLLEALLALEQAD